MVRNATGLHFAGEAQERFLEQILSRGLVAGGTAQEAVQLSVMGGEGRVDDRVPIDPTGRHRLDRLELGAHDECHHGRVDVRPSPMLQFASAPTWKTGAMFVPSCWIRCDGPWHATPAEGLRR